MNSIKNLKLSNIVAILTVVFLVAVAWALLANNAFATDEEVVVNNEQNVTDSDNGEVVQAESANEAEPNANYQISFNIKGLAPGDTAFYQLSDDKSGAVIPYNLGDKLTVDGETAEVDYKSKSILMEVLDKDHDYIFAVMAPLGYKFSGYDPADEPSKIDSNIEFSVVFEPDLKPYTLKVWALDLNDGPLPGAIIRLFNSERVVVAEGTADANGLCEFKDLSAHDATGTVLVEFEGLADGIGQVLEDDYGDDHVAEHDMHLNEKSNSNCVLENDDPNHDHFEFVATYSSSDDVPFTIQALKNDFYLVCDFVDASTWEVKENGDLYSFQGGDEMSVTYNVEAVGKSGYKVDYWLIGAPVSNAQVKVYPGGDPITLASGEILYAMPVYTEAPQPGPEPTPTEDVTAVAQTGDSTPLAPFALLAILSVASCAVFARKRILNK